MLGICNKISSFFKPLFVCLFALLFTCNAYAAYNFSDSMSYDGSGGDLSLVVNFNVLPESSFISGSVDGVPITETLDYVPYHPSMDYTTYGMVGNQFDEFDDWTLGDILAYVGDEIAPNIENPIVRCQFLDAQYAHKTDSEFSAYEALADGLHFDTALGAMKWLNAFSFTPETGQCWFFGNREIDCSTTLHDVADLYLQSLAVLGQEGLVEMMDRYMHNPMSANGSYERDSNMIENITEQDIRELNIERRISCYVIPADDFDVKSGYPMIVDGTSLYDTGMWRDGFGDNISNKILMNHPGDIMYHLMDMDNMTGDGFVLAAGDPNSYYFDTDLIGDISRINGLLPLAYTTKNGRYVNLMRALNGCPSSLVGVNISCAYDAYGTPDCPTPQNHDILSADEFNSILNDPSLASGPWVSENFVDYAVNLLPNYPSQNTNSVWNPFGHDYGIGSGNNMEICSALGINAPYCGWGFTDGTANWFVLLPVSLDSGYDTDYYGELCGYTITYSVQYNANGGTGTMSNSSHTYGVSKALTTNAFTRTGYTFNGWNTNADGTGTSYSNGASVTNLTSTNGAIVNLYAQWKANTYTVKYNANGGTGTMADSTYTYDSANGLRPNTFTRTGYTFNGWNTNADGTGTSYSDGQGINNLTSTNGATVNLYAQWTIANCTCTNGTGATGCVGTLSGSVCSFTWTCQDGYYNSTQSVTNNSVTFTATCNACSAPYTHSDGGRNSVTDCYRDCATGDLDNTTSVSGKYYSTGNNNCSADTCAAGYFRTYQVSDTGKPQSEYMCSACSASYPNHDADSTGVEYCYKSCATKTGYTLQSGGRDYYSAADTCSYTACTYSVKYNANGGSGTMSNSSHTYDTAKALTANTFTRTGYTFAGWNTAADGSGTSYSDGASVTNLTSTCGGTVNLYAKWTANTYSVKYNANGGSGTMSNSSHTYDTAKALTANTFTRTGYTFAGWNTAADGSGTSYANSASVKNLTSTNGATVNLYAKWTGNTITLQFANGGRGTAPTSPASCTYGGTFTMPAAMTATGYTFNKWSVNSKTFAAGASVTCNSTNLGVTSGTATITGTWNATTNNSCAAGYYWAGTKCVACSSEYYCPGVSNGVYDGGIKGREACPTPENTFEAMSATLLIGTTTDSNYDGVRDSITDCATRYVFAPSSYATSNSSGVDADYNANNNMNKVGLWIAACHWNTTTNAYDSNCSGSAFWCEAGYYSPQAQNISSVNEAADIVYSAETMTELATQVCVPVGANYWSPNAANPAGFDVASLKRVACPANSSTSGNTVNANCTCNTGYNYNGGTTTTTNACVANKYTITLDANGGTGGTATLYTTYATGVYTDSARSKAMTTSTNGITKPTRSGYTVTYDANGGSVSTSSSTSTYTFNGYYSASSGGTQYTGATYILSAGLTAGKGYTANKTWYAHWTSNSVTLPTPTRTGYTFGGWYTAATGGTKIGNAGASYTPTANVTLYAHWTANTYTITLNDSTNGGSGGNGTIKEVYATKWTNSSGTTISSVTVPTKSNSVFTGYYTASSSGTRHITNAGGLPSNTTFTSDTTLYAQFASCGCTKGTNVKSCTVTGVSGNKCTYSYVCNDGYSSTSSTFTGAAATATNTSPSCTTGNTITLKFANGGRGTAPTSPASCTYGSTFTMPSAMTATGYTFNKWTVNNKEFSAGQTSVACNYTNLGVYSGTATITATWTANTYTITLNDSTNGGSGGNGTIKEVYATKWTNSSGTTISSVTVPTKSNSVFTGYYTASSSGTRHITNAGGLPSNTTFTSDTTLYAQFASCGCTKGTNVKSCTVTGVSGNKCTYSYVCNDGYSSTSSTFTGAAATATNTSPSCTTGNTITLKFANGGHGTAPTSPASCTYGSTFTMPAAMTATGYTFNKWTVNGKEFAAGASVACNYTNLGVYSGTATITGTWTAKSGIVCAAGEYLEADTAECTSCPAGYYCIGGTFTYNGSDLGITGVCESGYSTGGASVKTCTACASGYSATGTSASNHDASSDCKGNTITVNYNENGGDAVTNGSCTYGSTITLPSAATKDGSVFAGWKLKDGTVKSAGTSVTCNYTNLGVYSGTSTAVTAQWTACAAGYYCPGDNTTNVCSGSEYSSAGAASCTACPSATGWAITANMLEQNGITDATGGDTGVMANRVRTKATEMIHLNAGTYTVSFTDTSSAVRMRGFYTYETPDDTGSFISMKSGTTLTLTSDAYVRMVFQKSTTSNAITPAEVISAGATLNKTNAYVITGTSATDHDNVNDCKISCPSGSYVAVAGGICVPVTSGSYAAASTVSYGTKNSASACPATNSGSDSGRGTNGSCYYTCPSKSISNGTTSIENSKVYYSGSAYPVCTYTASCNDGYTVSGNNSANPECKGNTITVNYNEDGGDAVTNGSCTYGSTFTLPSAATKDGSVFAGWKLKDGTVKSAGTSVTCNYTNLGVYSGTSTAVTATWTACTAGYYCPGDNSEKQCTGRTKYSAAGAASCSTVSAGYYTTGCNTSGNVCTGQSKCSAGNYCSGGVSNSCPSPYSSSATGSDAVNDCYLTTTAGNYVAETGEGQVTCACGGYCAGGTKVYHSSGVGSTTGGRTTCSAGTYNGSTGSSASSACKTTSAGYYAAAGSCSQTKIDANCYGGAGSTQSCPNSCPSPYSSSVAGSDAVNDCYLTTTAGNYVAETGKGQVTCAAGGYCAGGTKIYHSSGVGSTTGGRTQCACGTYNGSTGSSASSACKTTSAGYYASKGSSSQTKATAGYYAAAGACEQTVCSGRTKYSAAGASSCSTVSTGYYTTGCNTSGNACTGQSKCAAGNYCSSGVSNSCPAPYSSSVEGSDAVNDCYLTTTAGNYVAETGEGQVTCACGGYCAGGTKVYHSSGVGSTTGGRTTCSAGTYNGSTGSSALSACKTTSAGYYAAAGSCSQTKIDANCYGGAGSTQSCPNSCPTNSTSAAGSSSCTCNTGYNYNGGTTTTTNACVANKYTITLDANGGTGGTATLYTTYATGVYTDSARSKAMTTSTNGITKPTRSYTVTYDANGGSVSTSSSTSTYTFNGYYSAKSSGTKYTGTTYILDAGLTAGKGYTANKTWYAQWTSKSVTLPTPTRTGYTFAGWYDASTGGNKIGDAGASYTPTANVTLVAHWTVNTYTVTLNDSTNGGSGGNGTIKEVYATKWTNSSGTTISSVTVPTKSNSVFTGYYTASSSGTRHITNAGGLPSNTTFTSDTTLYAQFASCDCTEGTNVKSCTVTGVSGNKCTYSYVCNDGYSSTSSTFTGAAATATNTSPSCTGNTITVNYNENGGDAVTNGSCTYGSTFTLPSAATKDGSVFAGWKLKDGTVKNAGDSVTCNYTNLGVYSGTSTAITAQWTACAAGYYCPGDNTSKACPAPYSSSAAGSDAVNDCYLTTTAGNYVAETGEGQVTCACGGYCAGGTKVYHSSGVGSTTGGRTTCSAGTYNGSTGSSASSACKTTSAGYYAAAGSCSQTKIDANCYGGAGSTQSCPNSCPAPYSSSVAGSDAVNDCYLTTTAGNYVAETGKGQVTCAAGGYCAGGTKVYHSSGVGSTTGGRTQCACGTYNGSTGSSASSACKTTSAGYYASKGSSSQTKATAGYYAAAGACEQTVCSGRTKYSAAGASSCSTVSAGYYTTGCNTSGNACTGQSKCGAGNYCSSGVSNSCPAPYSSSVEGSDAVNDCYLTTTAGKYVAETGEGEVTCACGGYCAGGTKVYHSSGVGSTTGGRTTCSAGTYNGSTGSSASSACKTTSAGYYAVAGSCSQTKIDANCYGGAGSTQSCPNSCPTNSTSAAGSSSCTCNTGYNYNGGTTTTTNACVANKYTITLDANGGTGGTATLYTTYATGVYTDSARSKAMTTSTNGITKPTLSYTVTYNANGGSVSTSSATSNSTFSGYYSAATGGTQYTGATYILSAGLTAGKGYTANKTWYAHWTSNSVTLPTPTRTGYTFAGWYDAATGGNKIGDAGASYTPTADVTLYAHWTACTYSVKYNANGGSGTMSNSSHTYDTAKALTANTFTRVGYTFAGWNTAADGTGTNYADKASVKNLTSTCGGTVNLYAKWNVVEYTIEYYDGSTEYTTLSPTSYTIESAAITLPNPAAKSGQVFGGWYTSSDFSGSAVSQIAQGSTGDKTFYAKWTTVTCSATNGTCGTVTVTNNVPSVTIECNTGYSKSGNADRTHSFTVTGTAGATSLSGSCSAQCNVVAIDANGGTSGSITKLYKKTGSGTWYTNATCTATYATTTNVLPTRSGYTLRGLYDTKYADVDSDNNVGQRLIALAGNSGTLGNAWKITEDTPLYAAWAKNCVKPSNGTCSLTIKDYGYTDYTTSCDTGYTLGSANTNTPTCSANCNKITLNHTTNGGTGGTTAVYKKTGLTTYYSDSSCVTSITSITKPSKTNASYAGTYTTSALSGGTACINSSGTLSTSTDCNVTGATTWYSRYNCSTAYRGSGTTISGTCTGSKYTVVFNKNADDATGTMSNQSRVYADGTKLTANAFTRAGYAFAGWNTAADGTGTAYTDQTTGNLTSTNGATVNLYAQWTGNTITLKFANGGRGTAPTSPASCTYGSTFTMPSAMTATGYTFNKWTVNNKEFSAGQTSAACNSTNLGVTSGTATITGTWTACTAGYYCPGDNTSKACPAPYSSSAAGSDAVNDCYLTTTAGNYVAETGKGQVTCACGGYCAGGTKVYHSSGVGSTTGGRTTCSAGTYNGSTGSSASSACKTTSAGYYAAAGSCSQTKIDANCYGGAGSTQSCPNSCPAPYSSSVAGSDAVNDCYLTTTAGNYVAETGKGQVTCAAGGYCAGGTKVYHSSGVGSTTGGRTQCACGTYNGSTGSSASSACKTTSAGYYASKGSSSQTKATAGYYAAAGACEQTVCSGRTKYSAAGASSCSTVSAGYYTTGCNTSGNACTGQSKCGTGNYCVGGVQNSCATGLTTIGYGTGADEYQDCGRILYIGGQKLYLRSAQKTEHALKVKIGDTTFYGNMSTTAKNISDGVTKKLRVNYNGTKYYVHDDSVQ